MSITIGNLINETLLDNRFKINTYNNSNILNLNIEGNSYNDAIINFKNIAEIGLSNSLISFNYNNNNIFNTNLSRSFFNNNFYIKNNFNIINDTLNINSNFNIYLTSNINNSFKIINNFNNSNNNFFEITNSNFKINFNNSNKLLLDNKQITFNDNITINSNYSLIVSNINSFSSNFPIIIDNATFKNLIISTYNVKNSISIDNDTLYPNPSIFINRYLIDCNIIDIYNKNIINNSSNRIFSINNKGFIGIGSNIPLYPIDINLNSINIPYIFNYLNNCNIIDNFIINNKGYIGIGTNSSKNHLNITINDDKRNIINYPVINLNLNYDINCNFRTSNIIDLQFIAIKDNLPIYNDEDAIIGFYDYQYDNFISTITNSFIINPPTETLNTSVDISVINTINNDYIINSNISSLINYINYNYPPYKITNNDIDYFINYNLKYPNFLYIDKTTNPSISIDSNNIYHYNITYTSYVIKDTTILPIVDTTNLILKENKKLIYIFNPNDINSFSIFLIQKLYIEKNIYELKSLTDTINFIYQPPNDLFYATSNNNFSASLTADGKLSLGDKFINNDYYLYVNKTSRLNNLECDKITSIKGKKNINFGLCNVSNINKAFINSNIVSNLIVSNSFINNSINNNIISSNIISSNINVNNLKFNNIFGSNISISSNLFNINLKTIIGTNILSNLNNSFLNINVNSNFTNGLSIQSFSSNINPSISINGFSSNVYPFIIMSNLSSSYSLNITSNNNKNYLQFDNFSFIDNKNNRTIFKHIIFNDNNNNQFIFGNNNIIFDLKPELVPTNSTNKISFGFPYRFLIQNNSNVNNWDYYFKENSLNSDCMFNIYGNINFSTINNTPFLKCIATDFPNENISINIAGATPKTGFVFNVNGNSFFSSNINVDNDIFIKGTIGNVSDIRLKDNLIIINNPLDKIKKINGYIYTRKDTGKTETGLIAQEVLNILPEVVNNNPLNDYYNISYGNMMGLLVEAIKELNNKIDIINNKLNIS